MAVGRHKANPSGVKARLASLDAEHAQDASAGRRTRRRRLGMMLLNLLTVAMLSVCFVPYDCWYLAFIALAPWTLALSSDIRTRWAVLGGTIAGTVFWAINLYWMWWITLEGYFASVFYLSIYWLLAAIVVRAAIRKRYPLFLVLPVVWVALEFLRNYVIGGFAWFFLAHSQWTQTRFIQISDVTGQYGVSFIIAMVNGLAVDLILARRNVQDGQTSAKTPVKWPWVGLAAAAGAIVLALGYGTWRLGQQTTEPGPVIGMVQQAYPIALGVECAKSDVVFRNHIESSKAFIGADCDLVIWAETMLPRWMNNDAMDMDLASLSGDSLRSLAAKVFGPDAWSSKYSEAAIRDSLESTSDFQLRRQAAKDIGILSIKLRCPIMAGGTTLHRNPDPVDKSDIWNAYNCALWFDRSGRCEGEYAKIHLVPFSEYVPFKKSWPWLYQTLCAAVPPEMERLEPGTDLKVFDLKRGDKTWRIASPICFEGTFDDLCRKLTFQHGKKSVDVLVNISNDGWFIWKGTDRGSNENAQHMAQYAFRAVENRLPVVRVVNTGISAAFDSSGRLTAVIQRDGRREMVVGNMLLKDGAKPTSGYDVGRQILVDSRLTLYSRFGDVFALAVAAAAVLLAGWLTWKRPRKQKQEKP